MISCTEFIPLYSEFFKFLEKLGGHEAVEKYWDYVSENRLGDKKNSLSMISFLERDGGFFGAVNYWNHTLAEEACDLFKIVDPVGRVSYTHMRHCPSKGMLNELSHIEPYYDYCGHCKAIYTNLLSKYGIEFEMDCSLADKAQCEFWFYEQGSELPPDFKTVSDGKLVTDMKAEDNKYLHRGFYISLDFALLYCAENFGEDALIDFLADYTRKFYTGVVSDVKNRGLTALAEWISDVYCRDEASDVLHITKGEDELLVTIDRSPVLDFMRSVNHTPSKYVIEQTRTVYKTIAEECGIKFELLSWGELGEARFRFYK